MKLFFAYSLETNTQIIDLTIYLDKFSQAGRTFEAFRKLVPQFKLFLPRSQHNPYLLSHTQPCAPLATRVFRARCFFMVEISYVYNQMHNRLNLKNKKNSPGAILDCTFLNIFFNVLKKKEEDLVGVLYR